MPRTAGPPRTGAELAEHRAHQRELARKRLAHHRELAARALPIVRAIACGDIETIEQARLRSRAALRPAEESRDE